MNICVFAGSTRNIDSLFYGCAFNLGKEIGEREHTLVYGGSDRGLMGAVAFSAMDNGGKIIEVIPELFADSAIRKGELILTKDLRDRKAKMWEISDGFVALPGGFGTLDEIADAIVASLVENEQGKPVKPLAIINSGGFYDLFADYLNRLYEENFAPQDNKRLYSIFRNPAEAVSFIEKYSQPRMKSKVDHIEGR